MSQRLAVYEVIRGAAAIQWRLEEQPLEEGIRQLVNDEAFEPDSEDKVRLDAAHHHFPRLTGRVAG
jgi:hypothetical protein